MFSLLLFATLVWGGLLKRRINTPIVTLEVAGYRKRNIFGDLPTGEYRGGEEYTTVVMERVTYDY